MAATDRFFTNGSGIGSPVTHAEAVTPHDTNELTYVTRGLWVGGAGNVAVVMFGGEAVTIPGVGAGTMLPIRVKQVKLTGTTATLMVAFD